MFSVISDELGAEENVLDVRKGCWLWPFPVCCCYRPAPLSLNICLSLSMFVSRPPWSLVLSLPLRLQKDVSITCSFLQGTCSAPLCSSSMVSESALKRLILWPHQTGLPPPGTRRYVGEGSGVLGGISDAVGGGVDLGSGYLSVSTRREEGDGFIFCFVFSIIIISWKHLVQFLVRQLLKHCYPVMQEDGV